MPITKSRDTNDNVILRDYRHASSVFLSNKEALTPKLKFQFHVYFSINDQAYSIPWSVQPNYGLGLAVKTVKLPQFSVQSFELNQYNRKRIVQTKIKYENIDLTLHDDIGNSVRNMWYNYYSYYYDDANNSQKSSNNKTPIDYDFTQRTQYQKSNPESLKQSWGYIAEGSTNGVKKPFFRNIIVYGLDRYHNFVAYTLINPVIVSFNHDTYNYSEGGGTMENRMSLSYEFVKYDSGVYDGSDPSKMIQEFAKYGYYDPLKSPRIQGGVNASPYNGRDNVVQNSNRETAEGSNNGGNHSRNSPSNPYAEQLGIDASVINNTAYKNNPTGDPYNTVLPPSVSSLPNSIRNAPFSTPVANETPLPLVPQQVNVDIADIPYYPPV
jgi:hypothetical protein